MSHQGSQGLSDAAGRTVAVKAGDARFASGGELLSLYNVPLLFLIKFSMLEARSASTVSAKRHTKASPALRLDIIWSREGEGDYWLSDIG